MKPTSARILFLACILALLLTACDSPPLGIATLAPTAAAPPQEPVDEPANQSATPGAENTALPESPSATPPQTEIESTNVAGTEIAYAAVVAAQATPTLAATPTEATTPTPAPPPTYTVQIINTYPHDPTAFTQGLVFDNGKLYEGTGRWGESTLREVALETGTVLRSRPLEEQYFGEGITVFNDKIYQLTWQEQMGFIYDKTTFEPVQTFNYTTEGWGITHDDQRLIVSDGTSTIYFWDPNTLQETGRIIVRDHTGPLNRLNELEFVNGEIWANIWLTDLIARISPETGDVLGYIDLKGLLDTSTLTQPADVLNGIAYDAAADRLFVTGKLWPTLFEIKVVPTS